MCITSLLHHLRFYYFPKQYADSDNPHGKWLPVSRQYISVTRKKAVQISCQSAGSTDQLPVSRQYRSVTSQKAVQISYQSEGSTDQLPVSRQYRSVTSQQAVQVSYYVSACCCRRSVLTAALTDTFLAGLCNIPLSLQ